MNIPEESPQCQAVPTEVGTSFFWAAHLRLAKAWKIVKPCPPRSPKRLSGTTFITMVTKDTAPQQLLGILRSPIQVQVPESQGKAIYTFIDHHVYRAIGSLDVVVAWGSRLPYYRISHQGNLVREGTFRNSRPLLHLYYKILGMSHTLAYVGYNLPSQIQQPHFALTSKIIETARDEYLKKFPKGEFYVLLYPGNSFNAQMTRFLEEAKVKTLDYSSLFNPNDPAHHIHLDGHPSKKAYQLIAQQIVKDLRLDLKSNVELSGHRLDEDRSL